MQKAVILGTLIAFFVAMNVSVVDASGAKKGSMVKQNSSGGVTAVKGGAVSGPQGNKAAGVYGVQTDGQGNVRGGSAQGFSTQGGASGARAGTFSRSSDGSAQRQGGAYVQSDKGTVKTQGAVNKNADGTIYGSRQTSATNSQGYSYEGSSTYSSESGANHSGTCYSPTGEVVSCKK